MEESCSAHGFVARIGKGVTRRRWFSGTRHWEHSSARHGGCPGRSHERQQRKHQGFIGDDDDDDVYTEIESAILAIDSLGTPTTNPSRQHVWITTTRFLLGRIFTGTFVDDNRLATTILCPPATLETSRNGSHSGNHDGFGRHAQKHQRTGLEPHSRRRGHLDLWSIQNDRTGKPCYLRGCCLCLSSRQNMTL